MKESEGNIGSKNMISKSQIAWRMAKTIVFIVCFTGFTYQSIHFFKYYYTYPTVITVEVSKPETIIAPALTFCYTSQFKRSKYCNSYPKHCKEPNDPTLFCQKYPHYCRTNTTKLMIPKSKYMLYENYVNRNNTSDLCHDASPIVYPRRRNDTRYFIQTRPKLGTSRFLIYPCFSRNIRLQSHLEPTLKRLDKRTSASLYRLTVNAGQDEMFDHSAKPGILFSLHSAFEPVNPYVKGSLMKHGRSYQIHITLQEDRLLESPYKTDCMNYTDLWMKSNKTGPRSREMCLDICQETYSLACRSCVWGISMYKEQWNMCEMNNGTHCIHQKGKASYIQAKKECKSRCKLECVKMTYDYTVEERTNIPTVDDEEGKSEWLGYSIRGYIDVDIFLDEPEIQVFSYKPQYRDVEAFSYVGGFMGCWLGISIWAFAHNIGSVFTSMVSHVKNCARRPKKSGKEILSPDDTDIDILRKL